MATVLNYLGEFTDDELDILLRRLLLSYSGQYRFAPDVAILDGIKKEINSEERDKVSGNEIGVGGRNKYIQLTEKKFTPEDKNEAARLIAQLASNVKNWKSKK